MKLRSLKVTRAYGYLDFSITFNRDLTFLVGINGSGKTTALKLIEALLTPSLAQLDKIPHQRAELTLMEGRRAIKIVSRVVDDITEVSIPSLDNEDNLLVYIHPENGDASSRTGADPNRDPYAILTAQLAANPVIVFLRDKLDTPLFLGIDRRNVSVHFEPYDDRASSLSMARQRALHLHSVRRRMPISGQLGSSLVDVQLLIQEIYRKTAEEQTKFSSQLRESIFLDAFDYQPGLGFLKALREDITASQFLTSIINKRQEVENALTNSGVAEQKYRPVVSKFFTHIDALLKKSTSSGSKSPDSGDVAIELAFNKPVVDRVLKLIQSSEAYNKSINQLWSPINDFLSLVNQFLSDSGKELAIDQVGWLNVRLKGQEPRSLEVLSSGERQIVVIFGHLAINRELNRAGIFVIDEPELSLHLKWQQIFVDSLLTVNPKNQFLLATHSPGIVLDKEEHCVDMERHEEVVDK